MARRLAVYVISLGEVLVINIAQSAISQGASLVPCFLTQQHVQLSLVRN